MDGSNLFSKGFPTNRIPVVVPSSGRPIVLRETTVTELKSIAKTIIDNFDRRNMDVIYDAVTEYLKSMILTDDVDVNEMTELDRLFCLMVFYQISFYKDPVTFKCPHCGVEIVYRYDMSKYLAKIPSAYVEDQTIEIPYKSNIYEIVVGWPLVKTVSKLMHNFYNTDEEITEEMEKTQFGINYILSFVKHVKVKSAMSGEVNAEIDVESLEDFRDRLDCINSLPSVVMFDDEDGVFGKIMGFFINRLENCFYSELCPQCHKDTYQGLPQSSLFYSLFYGSIKSLYGFILQVECLMVFRYDSFIFDKEHCLTYNDLANLMKQLSTTVEKDNKERQKVGHDHLYKGLWYIREILNSMIFPEDRKHSNS